MNHGEVVWLRQAPLLVMKRRTTVEVRSKWCLVTRRHYVGPEFVRSAKGCQLGDYGLE